MSFFRKVHRRLRRPTPTPPPPTPQSPISNPQSPSGFGRNPNWPNLLAADWPRWQAAVQAAENGPPVLIATSVGGFAPGTVMESLLAVALTLRGARVHTLLCDEFLPACMQALEQKIPAADMAQHGPRSVCKICYPQANNMYASLGLPNHHYSDWVTAEERAEAHDLALNLPYAEIPHFCLDGLAVGEHALAGALRFYARGNLEGAAAAEPILRRYFEASLLTARMAARLLTSYPFTCATFNHGIYVPQGIIGEVARQKNVRVVNWNPAYRKRSFIFTHHRTYHHELMNEPVANWANMPWTQSMDADIMAYLKSRWQGTRDWIWFHEKPQEELDTIAQEFGIDFSRPCIGLLTNVMWDAQLHYPANAFANMLDWTLQTIQYFAGRPDLQLIIRIHPAEIRGTVPSRQPLAAEIAKAFPTLPPNVFVIPPESNVSTYAVTLPCNAVIIYGTKTGVELTSMGVPVIVAGEAWIRNKGLTLDANSPQDYFQTLDQLPFATGMDEATTQRARQYAYHFFFRRMIPLEMMEPAEGWPPYRIQLPAGLDDLLPGRSPGLDIICDGILHGREFIYPAESGLDLLE